MVDKEKTAGFDTFLEVSDRLLLFALIAKGVRHVGEGISEANDCVEAALV